MCKHILNAQVAIRSPCCRQWFDCAECHAEFAPSHKLAKTLEMTFMCKNCRRAFRKDMSAYEESDEYCPHCDNHYVVPAETRESVRPARPAILDDPALDARMQRNSRVSAKEENIVTEEELAELLDA